MSSMSIFYSSKPAKIVKKILGTAAVIICCIIPLTVSASAAGNEIKLEANGSDAALELYFPQAAAEGITSMQVSLYVTANSDGVDLEFIPDSSLSAKIVESRYNSNTGTLNIYIAGTETLFSSYGYTKAGVIRISTGGSGTASASVEVVRDSVKFVRSGELVSPDNDTDYPASVTVTAAKQFPSYTPDPVNTETPEQSPTYTPNPVYPSYPAGNIFTNIPLTADVENNRSEITEMPSPDENDGYADFDFYEYAPDVLEEQEAIGENMNPPDLTALLEALSRAAEYKREDYTESSYAALEEAVNNAKKLIRDPYATQDDIDEALLNIENAIGMLRSINDIPSGAEGYVGNNNAGLVVGDDNGIFGENDGYSKDNGYGQGNAASDKNGGNNIINAANGGDAADASDGVKSVGNLFFGNGDGGKSPALWATVLAVVAAAAAAAVIVLKKTKGKKSNGDHFKN